MNTEFLPSPVIEELKRVQNLLQLEKEEDVKQYKARIAVTSFKHRRKTGVCWYPVKLEKSSFDKGERLIVRVTRSREHQQVDGFQSGKLVSLFSTQKGNDAEISAVNGVVNNVKENEMFITLNCDELPQWVYSGALGVQLLFDENSYKEMEYTLRQLQGGENKRLNELIAVVLGNKEASFDSTFDVSSAELNQVQNVALNQVLNAKDIAIIHGPPGTGKTTTIVACIQEVTKNEGQVLVCAPSNAAVDLLVEKLNIAGVKAIRLGHPARVTEEALSYTLDAKIANHKDYKTLRQLRKKSEEFFAMGGKWKRNFGRDEREQRGLLLNEARKLKKDAEDLSNYISASIIEQSQVIACTLVGANNRKLRGVFFNTVFIDEAGQALEPACWIPILRANRVVFAGDHQQLPPTVKSFEAGQKGLKSTLFEKAIQRNEVDVMLTEQYRMNEEIMNFSSTHFYDNKLVANETIATHKVDEMDTAFEFIDTAGTGFSESVDPDSNSTLNKEEAELLIKHLSLYLELLDNQHALKDLSIGIISPYRAQVELLTLLVDEMGLNEGLRKQIKVNTIDSFQGQERDVIYISLVRSNDKGEIGFLADERRMNVAMTRARKKLVMIGDSATICRTELYQKLVDYVHEISAYKSAFELLY